MRLHILILLFIFGCASSKPTIMPSGYKGHSVDCTGSLVSMNRCYEKAAELCPHGYDIQERLGESSGWMATANSQKGLLITCKGPASDSAIQAQEGECMKDEECGPGKVCATVKGEYPGACADSY